MPIDPNVFDKIKTFSDYQKADQAFQLQKALQAQQLQTGGLEQQAKQLSLVGQIVGNNSVDQESYNRARQTAAGQGLDISALPDEFNPDIINRLRFAGATPTAQLSALISSQGHQLKAGIAAGDIGAYGYGSGPSPMPVANNGPMAMAPALALQPRMAGQPVTDEQFNALFPAQDAAPAQPIAQPVVLKRQPPSQRAGETTASYNARVQAWKSDPDVVAQEEKAKKTGADSAEAEKAAVASDETFQRLNQNLDSLKSLNNNLPDYGGIVPVGAKARASLIMGDSTGYDAKSKWDEINQQQVINAIGELVKGGQIRGNQFIERIINRGFAVDPEAPKSTRADQVEILRKELDNARIQAKNTNVSLNGGSKEAYQPTLPQQPSAPAGAQLYGTSGGKNVYKLPDGSFVMEQ